VVHRDEEQVRIVKGTEEFLAEGDYVEVLAFGRLWVVDGTQVRDLPPMLAHGESELVLRALDYAAAQGCPVGVKHLSTERSTGAVLVGLGKDREQVCTMTVGVYTRDVVHYTGPDPEPEQLTLAVGEKRDWKDMRFELEVWDTVTGLSTVQLTVTRKGDEIRLAAPLFEADPLLYMEGEAFGHLVRVTGIVGGVVVSLDKLPDRLKLRVDQLDHVPAEARRLGCHIQNEAFLYDERRGSAVLTFRDEQGEPICKAVVGLVSGDVVAAQPL